MTTGFGDDADDDDRAVHPLHKTSTPSENWDDDFEFQPASTDRDRDGEHDATNAPRPAEHSHEQEESWDDAYEDEDPDASPVKRAPKVDEEDVEDWDSSDNEAHEHEAENNSQRDQEREFGAGAFEEEDKTVTARSSSSRVRTRDLPPDLPLPALPSHVQHAQYPHPSFPFNVAPYAHPAPSTSPTLSSFSIPISSNRGSIYSQDPLMPTASNSSAPHLSGMRSYPQAAGSTPPRKGRRLRKKSRPPEADIFELEDREPDPLPAPPERERPSTPPPRPTSPLRPSTPPPTHTPAEARLPLQPTPSPSLLTRIGSLKRWARRSVGPDDPVWRRGKSSTGPSEMGKSSTGPEELMLAEETGGEDPRTVSPTPAPGMSKKGKARRSRGESASGQKAGWFFRAGGGGSERDDVSATVPAAAVTPEPSPTKRMGLRRKGKEKEHEGETPTPKKRAKGKLVPALKATNGSGFQTPSQPASPTGILRDGLQAQQGSRPISMLSQSQPMQLFPLHVHGSASVGRSAGTPLSISVSGPAVTHFAEEENGVEGREKESGGSGMRSLMNGVRRLSLVGGGGHKRTKSTGGGGDVEAVEVARRGQPRSSTEDRPHSRVEDRPRSRVEDRTVAPRTSGSGARPVSRASAQRGAEQATQALLPPVELDSPLSPQYSRRGSLPWVERDRDHTTGSSVEFSSGSSPGHTHSRPAPTLLPMQQPHVTNGHSFSASATSLLTESPTRGGVPVPTSKQLQSFGTMPRSRTAPSSGQAAANIQPAPVSPMPQSASLGRLTASPSHPGLRRNSLGDLKLQSPPRGELKIPARISRAQHGLKRDMGMVREFARCVEQLKRLQATYTTLLSDLRAAYDASPVSPASRATSPAPLQFHLPSRPPSQTGTARKGMTANPNPSLQSVHQTARPSRDIGRELTRLEHEYGIWWECAELLVELGGGSESVTASNPNLATHSSSTATTPAGEHFKELTARDESSRATTPGLHVTSMSDPGSIFEHALPDTSKGPPQASPPHPSQWRASTGRHDLNARQLRLLKDMLSTPDPASLAYAAGPYGYGVGYPQPQPYPYAVEGEEGAQPWAAWNPSAITLPSEESSADPHVSGVLYGNMSGVSVGRREGKDKKRRASRLGMLGLRDLLRGLKRNAVAEGRLSGGGYAHGQHGSESSTSNSAEDDHYNRRHSPWHQHDADHVARQSTGPDEVAAALEHPPTRNMIPKSPRRPSLASIFRLGQKGPKNVNGRSKDASTSGNGNSTTEDERDADAPAGDYSDWERMSRSDLDLNAATVGSGMTTVRGKKKAQPSGRSSNTDLPHSPTSLQSPAAVNISTPKKTPATSQSSLWDSSPPSGTPPHPSRLPLSIAEEGGGSAQKSKTPVPPRLAKERTPSWSQAHPVRPGSRNGKAAMTGTVRSAPPADLSSAPDPKLALTPENIKPLLEYAREVSTRLGECIGEVQTLLSTTASVKAL